MSQSQTDLGSNAPPPAARGEVTLMRYDLTKPHDPGKCDITIHDPATGDRLGRIRVVEIRGRNRVYLQLSGDLDFIRADATHRARP